MPEPRQCSCCEKHTLRQEEQKKKPPAREKSKEMEV